MAGLGALVDSGIFTRVQAATGTILVLALFFVALNLLVDMAQAWWTRASTELMQ